jgi:cellulose synthase/poly-beta-1,6-N-acetylglucosamine synthase-like glycosyltransferase
MEPNVGAVGGDIRVIHETNGLAGSLQAIDYFKSISVGRTVNSTLGILRIVAGAYGAFPASLLKRIKGWDVGPGLDGDITYKIRKLRYKTVHEPSAICFTNVPDTFVKLARQRFRWDRSLVRFRLRRHADVLSPRNKSFQFLNFFASLDNIVFNLVLNFKWWVYIFQMIVFHPDLFPVIFLINYLLYLASNMVEFFIACVLLNGSLRRKDYLLLFYLPLMPIYTGFYLRIIRTYAHLMEIFFKMSYEDRWNPWKVSRISKSLDR